MKKIIEFLVKHNKFICITLDVILIILFFLLFVSEVLAGFTAEQFDKSTATCCFAHFFIVYFVADIFTELFSKPKSDK